MPESQGMTQSWRAGCKEQPWSCEAKSQEQLVAAARAKTNLSLPPSPREPRPVVRAMRGPQLAVVPGWQRSEVEEYQSRPVNPSLLPAPPLRLVQLHLLGVTVPRKAGSARFRCAQCLLPREAAGPGPGVGPPARRSCRCLDTTSGRKTYCGWWCYYFVLIGVFWGLGSRLGKKVRRLLKKAIRILLGPGRARGDLFEPYLPRAGPEPRCSPAGTMRSRVRAVRGAPGAPVALLRDTGRGGLTPRSASFLSSPVFGRKPSRLASHPTTQKNARSGRFGRGEEAGRHPMGAVGPPFFPCCV